ncbi:MAG: hypothetical protein WBL63_23945 [Candidatus Acidiferrum sp.]
MRRRFVVALALSASFAAGLLVGGSAHKPQLTARNPRLEADAAFRDGVYQAKLDVQSGRKPHLSIARWNTEAARALFTSGYWQSYRELTGELSGPSVAELAAAGYRDGRLDGDRHRMESQPYQAEQTTNYGDAGLAYAESTSDTEKHKRFYREGYLSGYQQAYYSRPE